MAQGPTAVKIRVVLVEDDEGTRENLEAMLRLEPGLDLVGVHSTGDAALERIPEELPHVLLMDIRLPGLSGIEVVGRLRPMMAELSVLMLTTYEDSELVFESLRAGAQGYLLKNRPFRELVEAIHQVHEGGSPMSMRIARKVVAYFNEGGQRSERSLPAPAIDSNSGPERISDREHEVLSAFASGKTYKEIGGALGISENTVRTYVRRIYGKLQVKTRCEAVAKLSTLRS